MSKDQMKKNAALAALEYIEAGTIVGVGTGSTVNFFIDELAKIKHKIEATVSSSKQSTNRLKQLGIQVIDLNTTNDIPVYIDGADEVNHHSQMIKGGGGALTGEKIVASVAQKFICIADQDKLVKTLGTFPVAVEVIPAARSYVAREIVKLGGNPQYREGFISDWGNVILDVYHLPLLEPLKMEEILNNITGVVTNGIFAKNAAHVTLLGMQDGSVKKLGKG